MPGRLRPKIITNLDFILHWSNTGWGCDTLLKYWPPGCRGICVDNNYGTRREGGGSVLGLSNRYDQNFLLLLVS